MGMVESTSVSVAVKDLTRMALAFACTSMMLSLPYRSAVREKALHACLFTPGPSY